MPKKCFNSQVWNGGSGKQKKKQSLPTNMQMHAQHLKHSLNLPRDARRTDVHVANFICNITPKTLKGFLCEKFIYSIYSSFFFVHLMKYNLLATGRIASWLLELWIVHTLIIVTIYVTTETYVTKPNFQSLFFFFFFCTLVEFALFV